MKYQEWNSTFKITIGTVSLAENEAGSAIYPNPVKDYLHINIEEEINEVEIYNVLGVRLHNETSKGSTEKQ